MKALLDHDGEHKHLSCWLKHAAISKDEISQFRGRVSTDLSEINLMSQINVLKQAEHLATYPLIKERIEAGLVEIHAWWFDIATASVYSYNYEKDKFILIE